MPKSSYTAILEREGDLYVALCPEPDVASQGATVEEAMSNLKEAVELFLESADRQEIQRRLHSEIFVTRFDAAHGEASGPRRPGRCSGKPRKGRSPFPCRIIPS